MCLKTPAPDNAADTTPGTLVRLLEGELPHDKSKRKKAKPDLETLAQLPPLPGCPAGALLALGSGSKPQRETGVLVALDVHGVPNGRMATVDLGPLYAPLHKRFTDLNIEGAFVLSGDLLLLHRGNKGDALSACIRFDWNLIAPWLAGREPKPPSAKSVQWMELGEVDGVPLGLTDGTALQGGAWAFCAVAESTDNSYHDGACVGSAIGIVAPDGTLRHIYPLAGSPKVEGIAAQRADKESSTPGDTWVFTLVTDPDDPHTPHRCCKPVLNCYEFIAAYARPLRKPLTYNRRRGPRTPQLIPTFAAPLPPGHGRPPPPTRCAH
ncbi:MAG: hypothetical protein IPN06_00395 [Burkholderiales bacterium]|nr:hypothetical protein [Burkholderiales bacterium]